jgi:hypothetical protein
VSVVAEDKSRSFNELFKLLMVVFVDAEDESRSFNELFRLLRLLTAPLESTII